MKKWLLPVILLIVSSVWMKAQTGNVTIGGFVRGGACIATGNYKDNLSAAFADAALTLNASDNKSFTGFTDIRFRSGTEFGEGVSTITVKEAWGTYYNKYISVTLGKKIIKWGKSDFFTPLSKFNPTDYALRSPDREDQDLGNLLAEVSFTPAPFIKLTAVVTPYWNPSVLVTSPLELPYNIALTIPRGLKTEKGYQSVGLRGDLTLRGIDIGAQWYKGPELLPGLRLSSADFTDPFNPAINMEGVPYIITSASIDFEAAVSPFVLKGTFSYTKPEMEKAGNEEIPFPQLEWVAGLDWTPGAFRATLEYYGKRVLDFYQSPYDPIIGAEPDLAALAVLFSTPGFDPVEYARMQVEAFNRLYDNQLHEYYHSVGLNMETDLLYGRLVPSVSTMYNFTSHDLLILPAIKYKPSDGLTLGMGLEYYSGAKGGLYDIIDGFMDGLYVSLKIDF